MKAKRVLIEPLYGSISGADVVVGTEREINGAKHISVSFHLGDTCDDGVYVPSKHIIMHNDDVKIVRNMMNKLMPPTQLDEIRKICNDGLSESCGCDHPYLGENEISRILQMVDEICGRDTK